MNILEKIIDFCVGSIFESEEEAENRELHEELKKRIKKIQRDNKQFLIEKQIKPFIIAQNLKVTNLLLTEKELNQSAEYEFNYAKRLGLIDELNNIRITTNEY